MQEIITHGSITEYAEVIDCIKQSQHQHENMSITLYQVTDVDNPIDLPIGSLVQANDDGADTHYWLLDADEASSALAHVDQFLATEAAAWAHNTDWPNLEMYRWRLANPEADQIRDDYNGECMVVAVGNYYGYTPVDYIRHEDGPGDPIIFESPEAARAAIAELQPNGIYHLAHNEAGRPNYYIVPA